MKWFQQQVNQLEEVKHNFLTVNYISKYLTHLKISLNYV